MYTQTKRGFALRDGAVITTSKVSERCEREYLQIKQIIITALSLTNKRISSTELVPIELSLANDRWHRVHKLTVIIVQGKDATGISLGGAKKADACDTNNQGLRVCYIEIAGCSCTS